MGSATHAATNQPPERAGHNPFIDNPWLGAVAMQPWLDWLGAVALGDFAESLEAQALAREANRRLPELRTHDRFGRRADEVEYGHAYPGTSDSRATPRTSAAARGTDSG